LILEWLNLKKAVFPAVNLGNGADTTGTIYGQLAGAYYGLNNNPGKMTYQDAA
jgi:ADP-ribosyl-[dinitrogen reductase] hydrolase